MTGGKLSKRESPRTLLAAILAALLLAPLYALPVGTVEAARRARSAPSLPQAGAGPTTYGYGNARSGLDSSGPAIGGLSTAPAWNDAALDGPVRGEPLLDGATVYVATEGDSLYAIDAASGRVRWRLRLGTAVPRSLVDSAPTLNSSCGNIDPLGVTGTPVIDPASGELFAVAETVRGGGWRQIRHLLVAVSLRLRP